MAIDQFDLIIQFCIRVAALVLVTAVAIRLARLVSRPVGTYGEGLPERRMRRRNILRNPETVMSERLREPGSTAVG